MRGSGAAKWSSRVPQEWHWSSHQTVSQKGLLGLVARRVVLERPSESNRGPEGRLGPVAGRHEGFWSGQMVKPCPTGVALERPRQTILLGLVARSTGVVLERPSGSNRGPEGRFRTGWGRHEGFWSGQVGQPVSQKGGVDRRGSEAAKPCPQKGDLGGRQEGF